jgi:hypothetical protein
MLDTFDYCSEFHVNEVHIGGTKPDAKRFLNLFPVPCSLFPAVFLTL